MLPEVAPTEVGDRHLVDVRTDEEWAQVRAPGAQHVPMHELPARLGELPTEQPLAIVCHVGGRSAQVTMWLVDQGYDAVNVVGGMDAWERLGLPVEP